MASEKLKHYLNKKQVRYISFGHRPAYTAQEMAAAVHAPGREVVKTVMVKLDGQMAMAALPASYQISFGRLRMATGAASARLAGEEEFKDMFPDCEIGALPPFGNLYGLDVFAAKTLTEGDQIAFSAGSHTELINMAYRDYERLVKPQMAGFEVKLSS
jgi:Ala-tRNA(Pro) deacylase